MTPSSIKKSFRGQPGVDAPEAKLHHAGKWKGKRTKNVKEPSQQNITM